MLSTKTAGHCDYLEPVGSESAFSLTTSSGTNLESAPSDSNVATSSQSNALESPTHCPSPHSSPLPSSRHLPQCTRSRLQKIAKYSYVLFAVLFGFFIAGMKYASEPFDKWLEGFEADFKATLLEESAIWIVLTLLVITALKAVGMKDVLGVRTIAVVLLSYRMVQSPKGLTLLVAMLWAGVFSSISKLIEYRVIGRELQVIQGVPVHIMFYYFRKMLSVLACVRRRESWLNVIDPKWALEISQRSRTDRSMDIMTNLDAVLSRYIQRRKQQEQAKDDSLTSGRSDSKEESGSPRTGYRLWLWRLMLFCVSVVWTSCLEWVQPIAELFLYLHNWHLSARSAVIIVFAEFVDFDKVLEVWILLNGVIKGDIVGAKVLSTAAKVGVWAAGYLLILPITLIFAHQYHQDFITPTLKVTEQVNGEDNENKASDTKESTAQEPERAEDVSYSTDQKDTAPPEAATSP